MIEFVLYVHLFSYEKDDPLRSRRERLNRLALIIIFLTSVAPFEKSKLSLLRGETNV